MKIQICNKDYNRSEDQILAEAKIDTSVCFDSDGEWAIFEKKKLKMKKDFLNDEKFDLEYKPFVVLACKYVSAEKAYSGGEDYNENIEGPEDTITEKKFIKKIGKAFMKERVGGRLRVNINHGKNLNPTKLKPGTPMEPEVRCSITLRHGIQSEKGYGNYPLWQLYDWIDFSTRRRGIKDILFEVRTKNQFLGKLVIPSREVFKYPGKWAVNGLYNLVDKKKNMNDGELSASCGKIYIQMKWIPKGMKDTESDPPINDEIDLSKVQGVAGIGE